ncbi:MAG TPA: hypothetical protein VKU85_03980 [bacterium]|nr:hypothetical protein [bacterium]
MAISSKKSQDAPRPESTRKPRRRRRRRSPRKEQVPADAPVSAATADEPEARPTPPVEAPPPDEVTSEAEQILADAVEADLDVEETVRERPPARGEVVGEGITVFRERHTSPCVRYVLREVID